MPRTLALVLTLTLAAGCAGQHAAPPIVPEPAAGRPAAACPLCLDPDSPKILAAYAAAVEDAKVPVSSKISRDLTALLPATEGLIWNHQGQILMATWTKMKYYQPTEYRPGQSYPLPVDTWFTAAPFARSFCQALDLDDSMLNLRLEQLIGLPPGRDKDAFLEAWVDPTDLFRPCPDPEISDHECQVEIPVVGRGDQRPWDCSLKRQVSGKYVRVDPGHLRWMCDNWTSSYDHEELFDNYPWTALGYTYDWGHPDDHVGLSEFVAPAGSEVVFHGITPTEGYCSN